MAPRSGTAERRLPVRPVRTVGTGAVLAVLVAVAAPMSLVLPVPPWLRAVAMVMALGWAPGYCVAVLPSSFTDPLLRALLAVAVSLGLTVAVSTALLYLEVWTAARTLLTLCVATLLGATAASVGARLFGARP